MKGLVEPNKMEILIEYNFLRVQHIKLRNSGSVFLGKKNSAILIKSTNIKFGLNLHNGHFWSVWAIKIANANNEDL